MRPRDGQCVRHGMADPVEGTGIEVCNRCGRSVAWGSGRFANRVPDLNGPEDREALGRPYPNGDWICAECDEWCPDCGDLTGEAEE